MDRRGFLFAVGVGTLGVLTDCELSAVESGTALPASPAPAAAPLTTVVPTSVTPVLQRGSAIRVTMDEALSDGWRGYGVPAWVRVS